MFTSQRHNLRRNQTTECTMGTGWNGHRRGGLPSCSRTGTCSAPLSFKVRSSHPHGSGTRKMQKVCGFAQNRISVLLCIGTRLSSTSALSNAQIAFVRGEIRAGALCSLQGRFLIALFHSGSSSRSSSISPSISTFSYPDGERLLNFFLTRSASPMTAAVHKLAASTPSTIFLVPAMRA